MAFIAGDSKAGKLFGIKLGKNMEATCHAVKSMLDEEWVNMEHSNTPEKTAGLM